MAIYPEDFTQTECQQMIELMSGNRIDRLIELGLPEGTQLAHKIVAGPVRAPTRASSSHRQGLRVGDHIYEPDTDANFLPTIASWELIEEISRLTYNYFDPGQPLLQRREPINPLTATDCISFNPTRP